MKKNTNVVNTTIAPANIVAMKPIRRKASKTAKVASNAVRGAIASLSASYLPVATYLVAHHETKANPLAWLLVAGGLTYSAPTLICWAKGWLGHSKSKQVDTLIWCKAVGFTGLLEGVMVGSSNQALALCGLTILVLINASSAWGKASRVAK